MTVNEAKEIISYAMWLGLAVKLVFDCIRAGFVAICSYFEHKK